CRTFQPFIFCFVKDLKLHHGDNLHGAALKINQCLIDRAIFLTAYLEQVAPTPCNSLRVVADQQRHPTNHQPF
ncbi:hypothetical protein AF395_24040, partial [Salmonella enterica subsp. enterica serovar Typhimurium]